MTVKNIELTQKTKEGKELTIKNQPVEIAKHGMQKVNLYLLCCR